MFYTYNSTTQSLLGPFTKTINNGTFAQECTVGGLLLRKALNPRSWLVRCLPKNDKPSLRSSVSPQRSLCLFLPSAAGATQLLDQMTFCQQFPNFNLQWFASCLTRRILLAPQTYAPAPSLATDGPYILSCAGCVSFSPEASLSASHTKATAFRFQIHCAHASLNSLVCQQCIWNCFDQSRSSFLQRGNEAQLGVIFASRTNNGGGVRKRHQFDGHVSFEWVVPVECATGRQVQRPQEIYPTQGKKGEIFSLHFL